MGKQKTWSTLRMSRGEQRMSDGRGQDKSIIISTWLTSWPVHWGIVFPCRVRRRLLRKFNFLLSYERVVRFEKPWSNPSSKFLAKYFRNGGLEHFQSCWFPFDGLKKQGKKKKDGMARLLDSWKSAINSFQFAFEKDKGTLLALIYGVAR